MSKNASPKEQNEVISKYKSDNYITFMPYWGRKGWGETFVSTREEKAFSKINKTNLITDLFLRQKKTHLIKIISTGPVCNMDTKKEL